MVSEVTTTDSDDRLDRDARVYASSNNGCGSFRSVNKVVGNFGTAQGWQFDKHPQFITDLTGGKRGDIVGFGDAGVYHVA